MKMPLSAHRHRVRPSRHRIAAAALLCVGYTAAWAQTEKTSDRPATTRDQDCLIEPRTLTKLGAPVPGIVSQMLVERGDVVKAGQVVAELDSRLEQANIELQQARVANDFQIRSYREKQSFLARKLARQESLRAGNIVAAAAIDETTTDYKMAEAMAGDADGNLKIAKQELRRAEELAAQRRVVSPVDGIVVERVLSAGEYRHEQSHLVVIAAMNPLNVEVFLPIALYGQIGIGDEAVVMPERPVGGSHRASVTIVDRVFDAASGTFGVRLALPNADFVIPAGLRCKIRFDRLSSSVTARAGSDLK